MFVDFATLYNQGLLLWQGQYESLYPLPTMGLFALLALLPFGAALVLFLALSLIAYVATLKRDAILWAFYVPVLWCFYLGQVDIFFLWCVKHASPLSLALVSLKPQLLPFVVPALLKDRSKIKPFLLWVLAIYAPITALLPSWPMAWLAQADDGRLSGGTASSFWTWPLLWTLALAVLLLSRRLRWGTLFTTFSPFVRAYDYVMLIPYSKWAIPLSWLIVPIRHLVWPYGLLGLLCIWQSKHLLQNA